jgi:hypothetical protein
MGNWTPEGFIGQMFKTFAKFIAPSGMPAPVLWGDETVVRERLSHGVSDLKMMRRYYSFSYPFPPAEVVEFFRQYYGPTNRAFAGWMKPRREDCAPTWRLCGPRTIAEGMNSPWFHRSFWR